MQLLAIYAVGVIAVSVMLTDILATSTVVNALYALALLFGAPVRYYLPLDNMLGTSMPKQLISIIALLGSLLLAGCSGLIPDAYRIDIPQGNLITEEKVKQVTVGMNRRQVQRILGSPLLVDTFDQSRWDYFYSVNTKKGTRIEHHITIVFKDNVVTEIIEN